MRFTSVRLVLHGLILPVAFLCAQNLHEESLSYYLVTIDADVLREEGATLSDCRDQLQSLYEGVVVREAYEIGEEFKVFLIEDPYNKRNEVGTVEPALETTCI